MPRAPKIQIYPDHAGEWRWRLVGANGEIQASGEGYETKEHVLESVNAVARNFAFLLPEDWAVTEGMKSADEVAIDPEHVEVLTLEEADIQQ